MKLHCTSRLRERFAAEQLVPVRCHEPASRARSARCAITAAALGALATGDASLASPAGAAPRPAPAGLSHFEEPVAAAVSACELFVADRGGDSLTVVDSSSGRVVTVLSGARFGFAAPSAVLAVGHDVFVADQASSSVTEVSASTRTLVRVIGGPAARLDRPVALASAGGDLFVLGAAGVVTKLDATSGATTGVAEGTGYGFDGPSAIAADGGRLFVTDRSDSAVSEIDAATMKPLGLVRYDVTGRPAFAGPAALAVRGASVWVTDTSSRSLTEISAASGRVERIVPDLSGYLPDPGPIAAGDGLLFVASPPGGSPMVTEVVPGAKVSMPWMMCNTNGPYSFSHPQALVVDGPRLWVVNTGGAGGPPGNSLTEMSARSGKLVRVVR